MTETEWYKVAKDIIQALAWIGTVTAAVVAAFKAIAEIRANRLQREEELRWKQASLGRELLNEIFETANEALLMLDYCEDGRVFDNVPGENKVVTLNDILTSIDLQNVSATPKSIYIRERLEELFYSFERLEYCIENKLLTPEDVNSPAEYYAEIMARQKAAFFTYLNAVKYKRAIKFLDRFPTWKEAPDSAARASATSAPQNR